MAKEMIISVNGREKKIAILDNGRVTEFYIERGEEKNLVGNIYKGRVQRVLPGMQSAFVNIGLERDAFLYVSDFFDEEEEFERIVIEKSKKEKQDLAVAEKSASEQLRQKRLEREQQMEAAQERAEPILNTPAEIEPLSFDEIEEIEEIGEIEETATLREIPMTDSKPKPHHQRNDRNRGKRNDERGKQVTRRVKEDDEKPETQDEAKLETQDEAKEVLSIGTVGIEFTSDDNFERIVDEEGESATTGEIFKDAYIQERITDQVRAIEFDMDTTPTIKVGAFLSGSGIASGGFERIADDDDAPLQTTETSKNKGGGRSSRNNRNKQGAKNQTVKPVEKVEAQEISDAPKAEAETTPEVAVEKAKNKRNPTRNKNNRTKPEITQPAQEAEEAPKNQPRNKQNQPKKDAKPNQPRNKKVGKKVENANENAPLADAEASVSDTVSNPQMATRRGGRRRRGGTGRDGEIPLANDEATEINEVESFKAEDSGAVFIEEPRISAPIERNPRNDRNAGGNNRNQPQRNDRGSRNPRQQVVISDLLREGQEVLVQIAKEPIAKKGARITSHIALPGRYLVYMPTIEHVGVSRKIESSTERVRLRNVIQRIRNEEDVPSGGFIVRTAGIGIPEQNLREDARYLVRTWNDIKKAAEKAKSPALVHQDLDLVQRILRDQMSEDFATIRVDSEEEYLQIIEFINRVQPKMVNRVKLYTRDEPILETYNVQEEIDKAIKPRVWLKSGGYLVINQTEALVAIDVNTGKFVGKGGTRLEDTITKTNMEAVDEIARQIRLRDLGGIIVLDLIDMEDRRNRQKVLQALNEALLSDKSPTKVLSFNDFGLIVMTRKRVKMSLERILGTPCPHCEGSGIIKSPQTVAYEILSEARRMSRLNDDIRQTTLRVHPTVAEVLRTEEREVLEEIEAYLGTVDVTGDKTVHHEQFDFAFI